MRYPTDAQIFTGYAHDATRTALSARVTELQEELAHTLGLLAQHEHKLATELFGMKTGERVLAISPLGKRVTVQVEEVAQVPVIYDPGKPEQFLALRLKGQQVLKSGELSPHRVFFKVTRAELDAMQAEPGAWA
mgnify:CR=1 FL=1